MKELVNKVINKAKLANSSIHGTFHWQTVERNGLYLCQFNNADKNVIRLFAVFHDCMRENDGYDLEHGPRASKFIKTIKTEIPLNEEQLNNLCMACSSHTHGKKAQNETVATCWDADRLDIGRVGITPNENYLTNEEAKRIARENDFSKLHNFKFNSIIKNDYFRHV